MKRIYFALIFLFFNVLNLYSQDDYSIVNDTDSIEMAEAYEKAMDFTIVEEKPFFSGGDFAILKYIIENIQYSKNLKDSNGQIITRSFVEFIIDETGKVTNVRTPTKEINDFDREVVRVVESMPDWIPGKHNGEPVSVRCVFPLHISPK